MATSKKKEVFPSVVSASPNKDFFVHMLTRDIELGDAILDLLDNCVDGIVRSPQKASSSRKPYQGYFANISISKSAFSISDNCGGIPLSLAKEKAFHLGRPPGHSDGVATVGMYGIGMKRAIFKMGLSCKVTSRNGNDAFAVTISENWLSDPEDWDLPIVELPLKVAPNAGTTIEIQKLRPEVAKRFDESKDSFLEDFIEFVSQHYSVIIGKGFLVTINGTTVKEKPFRLLSSDNSVMRKGQEALSPYFFSGEIGGVQIRIAIGLYRPVPSEQEMEAEYESRASRDDAGWTIICNDRVVLYRDKTRLTGWGEAGVPNYHGQFIAISGVVVMHSEDPWALPLTTTKRGIDPSSEVYSVTKDFMREGMKYFTKFTNKWKKLDSELMGIYRSAEKVPLGELENLFKSVNLTSVRASSKGVSTSSVKFLPLLPTPKSLSDDVRISFLRPRIEVRKVAKFLLEDVEAKPGDVGAACFDRVAKQSKV